MWWTSGFTTLMPIPKDYQLVFTMKVDVGGSDRTCYGSYFQSVMRTSDGGNTTPSAGGIYPVLNATEVSDCRSGNCGSYTNSTGAEYTYLPTSASTLDYETFTTVKVLDKDTPAGETHCFHWYSGTSFLKIFNPQLTDPTYAKCN